MGDRRYRCHRDERLVTSLPFADSVALTEALVRIDSRNPSLAEDAPGERSIVEFLASVLDDWGFEVKRIEAAPGRPSIVARGGEAGGRRLMFNGHLDVVDVRGMTHQPFAAERKDGRMYGRGASDMKAGVAAMCAAGARCVRRGLGGELVIAAVCDEEWASIGTQSVIDAGVPADAAIVCEPTRLAVMPAHKGFVWLDIDVRGRAAHGSRWELGVDAIRHAGLLLAELDALDSGLSARSHPLLGRPSLHASTISGGSGMSTYPDRCLLAIERRTIPGESPQMALDEVLAACRRIEQRRPGFEAEVTLRLAREPSDVAIDAPVVEALLAASRSHGHAPQVTGMSAWTDAAILNAAGIPAICFGPGDIALAHADEEFVMIDEIELAAAILESFARDWLTRRG
jgi:acetylornithine deacetylase